MWWESVNAVLKKVTTRRVESLCEHCDILSAKRRQTVEVGPSGDRASVGVGWRPDQLPGRHDERRVRGRRAEKAQTRCAGAGGIGCETLPAGPSWNNERETAEDWAREGKPSTRSRLIQEELILAVGHLIEARVEVGPRRMKRSTARRLW